MGHYCRNPHGKLLMRWAMLCFAALCLPFIVGLVQAADLSENQAADIILSALQGNKQHSRPARLSPLPQPAESFTVKPGYAPLLVPYRISVDPVEVPAAQDKHASYLFSLTDKSSFDPLVGLAKVDRVDMVQFSRLTPNEYRAEFMVGYNASSLGSLLFGRAMQFDRPGEARLKLSDDGWRLKFLKRF